LASKGGSTRTRPRRSFGGTKAGSASQPSRSTTRAWRVAAQPIDQALARGRLDLAGGQAVLRRNSARAISGDPG